MTRGPDSISVIIPVYNAENTILSTLESVKDQLIRPCEIIVVDDGSSDQSVNRITRFKEANPELNLILISKPNGGVSSARNRGMEAASGKWIALLDSDDVWLPGKLARQIQVIKQNPGIDFLGTTRNDEKISRVLWKKFGPLTKIGPRLLLVKFVFVVPTVLFKKEILYAAGYFDEKQRYAEEGNFFMRICHQYNCFLLNESLVITGHGKAHFGQSGLSGNLKEMEKGELKNMRAALRMRIISPAGYLMLCAFSILKYIRRLLIVKLRRYA
jgi:glycosyltransferase involved in cell wall biosynthesis